MSVRTDSPVNRQACAMRSNKPAAMSCINRELTAADITCPATAGGNAKFNGCSAEQLSFAQCG